MPLQAIIEICPQSNGDPPFELINVAYMASWRGKIVFALRYVAPAVVDKALDQLVSKLPLNLPGVLYLDAQNEPEVMEAMAQAEAIFFATDQFRDLANSLDLRNSTLQRVELAFLALYKQTRQSVRALAVCNTA